MIASRDVFRDLVIANRVLANEHVVDAYGHVSLRNPSAPDRFFLSHSLAPAFVDFDDILEFSLDGRIAGSDDRSPYLERFIHAAIYEARPDVNAVVHAHAEDTLPFGITQTQLVPVIHSGSFIGPSVPVWDIATNFGDSTNLLVTSVEQGRDLARTLGGNNVVLMRGHGFSAAAATIIEVVRMAIYLPRNARAQLNAMRLGDFKPLSPGEIAARSGGSGYRPDSPETQRAWYYWAHNAGCADLLS